MSTITIPAQVAEVLRNAVAATRLVDEQGNVLGSFSPLREASDDLTPEELAELKRRMKSPGPWYTTQQVLDHIEKLGKG